MSATSPPLPRRRRRRWWRLGLAAVAAWWVAGFGGALLATRARHAEVPVRRELAGHAVEAVAVRTADGLHVRGWLVRAAPDSGACVVLAAGIRGNRLALLGRAEWYLARGWSTLLVDLRGTGESEGGRVALGWHEAADLRAWRTWLREHGFLRLGAHGQSLGAAAVVYAGGAWDFCVLEACYGDVDAALAGRLPWLPWPQLILWPLRQATGWLLGVTAEQLRPVDHIGGLHAPTLLLCGDRDLHVGAGGCEALLAASPAPDKRLVWIGGAGHVDLFGHDAAAVQAALAAFVPPPR